ncbi:XRE family transcriptional regulator [Nocardiopsis gilva YIM 90087]|uniref:XRE family transcriptional regulator n=1 Tax=Nocardiopsis gilva YIM 90087 TaxID=1235441 RepID=A0A223S0X7_9ACTN|nr:helix-turn-helix transcriptional regulator [Nocardiopsis gilva]ASU81771.1 XRE family transcriptional regulator [Nocardiopsis gilva YIM 90087]
MRSRRARLSPQDVGLPATRRRRTPGLRREEVASLAGIGLTWYTWLEQGRHISVTTSILDAVGDVLRLDKAERAHLYRLAGHTPAAPAIQAEAPAASCAPDHVVSLVEEWSPSPAYVLDRYWRYLYGNATVESIFGNVGRLQSCMDGFVDEYGPHRSLPEWEEMAPSLVAEFRSDAARYPNDPVFEEIVSRLSERSQEFARLWGRQEVSETSIGEKVVQHPTAGRLAFQRTTVQIADHPDLRVVVLLPKPGTGTRERVNALVAGDGG